MMLGPALLTAIVLSAVGLAVCVLIGLRDRYKASRRAYLAGLKADADARAVFREETHNLVDDLRKAGLV